jgi:hypothetical protein
VQRLDAGYAQADREAPSGRPMPVVQRHTVTEPTAAAGDVQVPLVGSAVRSPFVAALGGPTQSPGPVGPATMQRSQAPVAEPPAAPLVRHDTGEVPAPRTITFEPPSLQRQEEPADRPRATAVSLQQMFADPVVQRAADEAPPAPSKPVAAPTASGPAAATDLDELARRLYDPLTARLRAELWLDRERAGLVTDRWR